MRCHPGHIATLLPFLLGNGACPWFSDSDAPDMEGTWAVAYEDRIDVEITLDGATYTATTGLDGGVVTIDVDGQPLSFDLDCERDDVVCPSEVWPAEVDLVHREPDQPHRIWMVVPQQVCDGQEVAPDPSTCGDSTDNPDCEQVCDGDVHTEEAETFGVIDEDGARFWLLLGGGVRTNGVNCALLGLSAAQGALVTEGAGDDWSAVAVADGVIAAGYAGGCLWAGDVDDDGAVEALALGASVVLRTGYTAQRLDDIGVLPAG